MSSSETLNMMTIEYGNSESTFAKRGLMTAKQRGFACPRSRYYLDSLTPIILNALAAVAVFSCGSQGPFLILGCMLLGSAAGMLWRFRLYGRWLHTAFFPKGLRSDMKRIRLEITDRGLHEHQGDIVSFAPWKDVSETFLEDDLLVIKLSSGQEAIIPRTSSGISELDLEAIRREIESRRIQNGQGK